MNVLVAQIRRIPKGFTLPAIAESVLWFLFIGAMLVKVTYFQFVTNLNALPLWTPFNQNMLTASLTSVLFLVTLLILIFNKRRILALLCLDILLSVLVFSDTVYFRYYYNAVTIPVLLQLGLVGSITESIKSLLKFSDLLFLADIPLLIAGVVFLKKISSGTIARFHIVKRLVAAVILCAVSFVFFQGAYGKASVGAFPYDNNYVINNLGVLYFHYYDTKRFITENYFTDRTLSAEEKDLVEEYYKSKPANPEDKYEGIAKGKNVIVIQLEAIQGFLVNLKFNEKEVTPNLNQFIHESAYFKNFFYQIGGGNTSDAEFLTNNSLYPVKEGAVYFRYPSNLYRSTGKILKEQGYHTLVGHANNPSFWNRTEMYKAEGFDLFLSSKFFTMDEARGWGLGDKSFLRQSLDKLEKKQPFYGFLVTLSSHHPFNYFDDYKAFDVGARYEKTFVGNYMKAAHYVDAALGMFIEDLKRRGLYDNSILVIYGDHNAFLKDQAHMIRDVIPSFQYNDFNWAMLQKTPCFIHFPGQTKFGTYETIGGEIDILPTLANLMGFEAPYAMGKDLFNTDQDKGYAVLRNGTIITDEFVRLNSDGRVYDKTGKAVDGKKYEESIKEYENQLKVSDIILKKNALKVLAAQE